MSTIPWLEAARAKVGTREAPGAANNPTIMGWARRLGARILGIPYNADSVPWCGLFVAIVMREVGLTPPLIAVRASAWDAFGVAVKKPFLGAVMRYQRPGGGHVAILTGIDPTGRYHRVVGGNQGDAVNEMWIEASRCAAMRWPIGVPLPTMLAPVIKRVGAVSTNER